MTGILLLLLVHTSMGMPLASAAVSLVQHVKMRSGLKVPGSCTESAVRPLPFLLRSFLEQPRYSCTSTAIFGDGGVVCPPKPTWWSHEQQCSTTSTTAVVRTAVPGTAVYPVNSTNTWYLVIRNRDTGPVQGYTPEYFLFLRVCATLLHNHSRFSHELVQP